MNQQDPNITAIVKKLKETAQAHPWVPMRIPPQEHYHSFPNGLSICFTLDVLPEIQYWHLSIARVPGDATPEEIELWCRAFFGEEPNIVINGPIGKHFYWRIQDGVREG